jgi:hypothetical protein
MKKNVSVKLCACFGDRLDVSVCLFGGGVTG